MAGWKYYQQMFLMVFLTLTLIACGGSDDTAVESDTEERSTIGGVVYDESGLSVANATIYTVPATGQVTTNSNGSYVISDTSVGSGGETNYTVYAQKAGFTTSTTTVSLDLGSENTANLTIDRSVNGLVASDPETGLAITTRNIGNDATETSFVLSSTTANNTFSFDTGNVDWLAVSPSGGSIDEITKKIITVTANKTNLTDGVHSATIIGNGNTSAGVSLTVKVAVGSGVTIGDGSEEIKEPIIIKEPEKPLVIEEPPVYTPFGSVFNYSIDGYSYTITPSYCQLVGTEITCYMDVKANGVDAPLYLRNGYRSSRSYIVIDGAGYSAKGVSMAGGDFNTNRSYGAGTTLLADITYKAVIKFPGVPSNAASMDVMKLLFEARSAAYSSIGSSNFSPEWRDVVINQ